MKKLEKFCPKCASKEIHQGSVLCEKCAATEEGIEFKDIEMLMCAYCGRYMHKHKWEFVDSPHQAVTTIAKEKIKQHNHKHIIITPLLGEKEVKPGVDILFEVEVKIHGEEFLLPAKISGTVCPYCSKQGTPYFEGILQLRNPNKEVLDFIRSDVEKHKSQGVFISKEEKQTDGMDLLISSNKYLRALGKKLRSRYVGEFKESPRLFTHNRQTSRDMFRMNVFFRLKNYKVGDTVKKGEREITITKIGKRISGVDKKTGKKEFIDF
jgi:NMD protein affecting ribosome stability and mRNA decay